MNFNRFFFFATLAAAAMTATACKDDVEPGTEPSDVTGLYINEVCSGGGDWIELYNATGASIDLSGYHIQDNKGTDEEYTFPAGSRIDAKGFVVVEEGTFEFGISGDGDEITLLDEQYAIIDKVTVPAMDDYYTYFRTQDGGSSWDTAEGGTKGRSNTGEPDTPGGDTPDVPDTGDDYSALKLNELNGNDKFIEIYNTSDSEIGLAGVYFTKDGEDTFTFAENTVIPAKGFITVWSEKSDNAATAEHVFDFGLSADKSVKIELFAPDGESVDIFKNLSKALGETWGEDDGKYDSKDKGSFARETDGTGDWYIMSATEGETNAGASKIEDTKIEW